MNNPTEISRISLGKSLAKSFVKAKLKEGMSEQEIKAAFTIEVLNKMAQDFCEEHNFKMVD